MTHGNDTMSDLKLALSRACSISVDRLRILYMGAQRPDIETVKQAGLSDDCTVQIVVRPAPQPAPPAHP